MPAYCQAISTPLAPPQPAPPPPQIRVCLRVPPHTHTCVHKCAHSHCFPETSRRDANDYRPLRLFPLLFPAISSGVFSPILQNSATPSGFLKKIHPPSRFLHIPAWVNGSCHTCLRSRADTYFQWPGSVSIVLSGKSVERCLGFRWRWSERTHLCMQTCLAHGRNMQKMNVNLLCRFLVCSFQFKYFLLFLYVFSLP